MSRGNDNGFIVLIGSIRFVNHSCPAKTHYLRRFPDEGSPCVRLNVIDEILPDEEIYISYGSDIFNDGDVNYQCPNHTLIKPERASSKNRRLQFSALPESRFHSRIFIFVFAQGPEGSDSPSSNEEKFRGIPSSCLANAGLDFNAFRKSCGRVKWRRPWAWVLCYCWIACWVRCIGVYLYLQRWSCIQKKSWNEIAKRLLWVSWQPYCF